jgi:hypothetical protein
MNQGANIINSFKKSVKLFVSFTKFDTQVNNFFCITQTKRKIALNNCLNNEPGTATGDPNSTWFAMKLTEKNYNKTNKGILLFV